MTTFVPPINQAHTHVVFAVNIFTQHKEVGEAIFGKFLPQALAAGKFLASPKPEIVGNGLQSLQDALKAQKAGVSAKKIVVTF